MIFFCISPITDIEGFLQSNQSNLLLSLEGNFYEYYIEYLVVMALVLLTSHSAFPNFVLHNIFRAVEPL